MITMRGYIVMFTYLENDVAAFQPSYDACMHAHTQKAGSLSAIMHIPKAGKQICSWLCFSE